MTAALAEHAAAGRPLRLLTTTYTGSTEGRALDALRELGASIRVSYDTSSMRLHAKAWLFHRASGFSTAYIGSSNLTHWAQVTGLEWNVRVSGARNPDVIDKVAAVFEAYWQGGDFVPYDPAEFATRSATTSDTPEILLSPIEIRLEPFQERLLEQIALARQLGRHRNLLVSATGTGKTVMAAVDYARLRAFLPRARLLFVAHREEILLQSLATFRHALRDHAFGELQVGGRRPARFDHVFASIQSLHATGLADLAPDHFDVVVIDEFHHAAATTYQPRPHPPPRAPRSQQAPPPSAPTASPSSTGSTTASPPSSASGTPSTSTASPPSNTSASTTASTSATSPGAAAAATTPLASRSSTPATTPGPAPSWHLNSSARALGRASGNT
jgi:hypothetical protein